MAVDEQAITADGHRFSLPPSSSLPPFLSLVGVPLQPDDLKRKGQERILSLHPGDLSLCIMIGHLGVVLGSQRRQSVC